MAFGKSWPNGLGLGGKTKGEGWLLELKVDIFGYDNVNVIWSSRG